MPPLYSTYKDIGKDSITPPSHQVKSNIPGAIQITSEAHRNEIINSNLIVVIYNFTDWCGPCKLTSPAFDILSHKFKNGAMLVKEDVDQELEGGLDISAVPVFHFYIKGNNYNDLTVSGGDLEVVEAQLVKIIEKVVMHK